MKNSNLNSVLDQTYREKTRKCCDVISGKVYYDKIAAKILNVAKAVAEETMSDATKGIRENITSDYNFVDTGVSCDWTWQKKRILFVEWCIYSNFY